MDSEADSRWLDWTSMEMDVLCPEYLGIMGMLFAILIAIVAKKTKED